MYKHVIVTLWFSEIPEIMSHSRHQPLCHSIPSLERVVTVVATSPLYERNAINIAISSTDASQILPNLQMKRNWIKASTAVIYILLNLGGSVSLEHNKLLCLRTYIIFVIINFYPLDKTSALDQPCYQWWSP
jgi:hypothetical protein